MKVLSNVKGKDKIPTNSPLDLILDGGIERRSITQFYGPPGSGKTNIALNLAVQVAKNDKKVAYVDTEGGISVDRIKQLSKSDFQKVAGNIVVFEPNTFEEQEDDLKIIESWISSNKDDVDLLIIDSAVALYRLIEVKNSKSNKDLGRQMGQLSSISRKFNVAVVVTNQIYASFDDDSDNVVPVGGTILQYWSKAIIELKRSLVISKRTAILRRSKTSVEGKTVEFKITDDGIE
ncbi:MAG: DNA repair and recombination protein RadB [Methanobacteriaceae archaeon]|jgi:DNA repair protein RadB|uniref:DNA repair and recombination protein RadB n=1 Tax=unclassified Methanobrevibacter TaxID=2638681 RepID=UPI002A14AE64|nr:DNA repair and recombination protein RadB [Methanobacteriaceae archaeon]MDD3408870.1 DNA repair and recombination protein RadB [Methanobacteriaceae archaeon]MDD4593570.1 DNA repair and recombination protein RadB [Methanobacteriaceae archaeon]